MESEQSPSFGVAVVAVLIAGVASSYASALLVGVTQLLGWNVSLVLTSLVGAAAGRYFLKVRTTFRSLRSFQSRLIRC